MSFRREVVRLPTWRPGLFTIVLALTAAPPSPGQTFGRWWIEGSLGLQQRAFANSVRGQTTSDYDESALNLRLALNGYVVHPAIAEFQLGAGLSLTEVDSTRTSRARALGLSGQLRLFPRGAYPASFHASRRRFDYGDLNGLEAPIVSRSSPDTTTEWGARLRLRRGPLRGTLLRASRTELDFIDPRAEEEIWDRQLLDWTRGNRSASHHVRLERRRRDYGTLALGHETTSLLVDERRRLADDWRWHLSGSANRSSSMFLTRETSVDILRLQNQLERPIGTGSRISIDADLGLNLLPDPLPRTELASAAVSYRWRATPRWELTSSVQYAEQRTGDDTRVRAPGSRLAATWIGELGPLAARFGGNASYTQLDSQDASGSRSEPQLGLGVFGSLRHGESLRKTLEVAVTRDEVTVSRRNLQFPDLEGDSLALAVQDSMRVRVTLDRLRERNGSSLAADWHRREASGGSILGAGQSDAYLLSADYRRRTFQVRTNAGLNSLDFASLTGLPNQQDSSQSRTTRFASAGLGWQPLRNLKLEASARLDQRDLFLGEGSIDGQWLQITASYRIGLVTLDAWVLETRQEVANGGERINRGVYWAIKRSFARWLPIVSAPTRRGVIR